MITLLRVGVLVPATPLLNMAPPQATTALLPLNVTSTSPGLLTPLSSV